MKRIAMMVCAVVGLMVGSGTSHASWGAVHYSGYQPWWNIFAKRYKCLTPEEERLQKFWHDYYDAMKNFYCALDHIDWVAYYKNHGYQINAGCGPYGNCGRINYAPVFVSPTLQWAVPAGAAGGPPVGHPGHPGHMGHMGQGPVGFGAMPYPGPGPHGFAGAGVGGPAGGPQGGIPLNVPPTGMAGPAGVPGAAPTPSSPVSTAVPTVPGSR